MRHWRTAAESDLGQKLLAWEAEYWRDLLTRVPNFQAAARVADVHVVNLYYRLGRCGLKRDTLQPLDVPLASNLFGLTFRVYMDRRERWYWWKLFGGPRFIDRRRTISAGARVAGVNRKTAYNRMRALGIEPWKQPGGVGGNAAWRALDQQVRA